MAQNHHETSSITDRALGASQVHMNHPKSIKAFQLPKPCQIYFSLMLKIPKSNNLSSFQGLHKMLNYSHAYGSVHILRHLPRGGGGFQKMTLDDGGRGGLWSDDVIQNRSISGFLYLKKLFKPNNYAIIYCKQPVC